MKSVTYTPVTTDQAVRDFCNGRVVSIYANGEFYCAMERGYKRQRKARRKRYFARMIRRDMRYAQELFGGEVTCKSRPPIG